jgi:GT2 family glycosyltransferase
MSNPRLLVIVLNFRTADMTLRSAQAVLDDLPAGGELVIVDNASGDGSDQILAQAIENNGWQDRVRLLLSDVNGGFGAGNNIGIRAGMADGARPDYIYIVNSDAFVDSGATQALLDHMIANPTAGFVGSHVRGEDDVTHHTAFRFPSIASEFEGAARLGIISRLLSNAIVPIPIPETTQRVDWVAGASVMARGAMLDEIGMFDEDYFLYFEETDLLLRAARAGWSTWYLPASRVVHIGSVTTGMKQWQRIPGYWYDSRRRYFTKNHGRLYATCAMLAHMAGGVIHRARCALGRKTPQDPPGHLRDLFSHGLRRSPKPLRTVK